MEAKFERLDIAANNAGITIPAVPTADLPIADWKHGVIGMMKTVALEYGTHGIRALAVGPAFIRTGLEDNIPEDVRKELPGLHAVGRGATVQRWFAPSVVRGGVPP